MQLSLNAINGVMQQRQGMGKTDETYLVGPDKLMRSDSYFDPVNHSVKAAFAVVADEVRNLAMRAADAAKNTAGLIESTLNKVKDGSGFVTKTNEAFGRVAGSAPKVGELVSEIAAASNEQAQGIEQVNKAVSEMDKVVQQNAAGATESASASEQMNAQAEKMKQMVEEMVALMGGSLKAGADSAASGIQPPPLPKKRQTAHKAKIVKPEDLIPIDDSDFRDF